MSSVSRPLVQKRALLIAVESVSGKEGSKFSELRDLVLAHSDAEALRDFLIASRGYRSDDIILMKDDKDHPKDLWPTRDRILYQIDQLTRDAPDGCHFFFYFSGHALEEEVPDRACMRADGLDDEIVCADGEPILDYILHDRLVTPLRAVKESKLFALLDCCHSESLLDLQRGNGPNIYTRPWNIGPGQLFKNVATIIANLFRLSKLCRNKKRPSALPPLRRVSTQWRSPPKSMTEKVGELSVTCLSACRDKQSAHDDTLYRLTFTKCFINTMAAKSDITWTELHDNVRELVSEIRIAYEDACLCEADSGSNLTHESWVQSPRIITSPGMNLNRKVSL